jgi:two-component system response regulator NreC
MIKILVVDDQPSVREGLRMRLALEPDMRVVGEAADGPQALRLAGQLNPQVVILDVELPRMDGIAVAGTLSRLVPRSAVVIHSLHDNIPLRERARSAGAAAFVSKLAGDAALLAAIRAAAPSSKEELV